MKRKDITAEKLNDYYAQIREGIQAVEEKAFLDCFKSEAVSEIEEFSEILKPLLQAPASIRELIEESRTNWSSQKIAGLFYHLCTQKPTHLGQLGDHGLSSKEILKICPFFPCSTGEYRLVKMSSPETKTVAIEYEGQKVSATIWLSSTYQLLKNE